MNNTDQVKVTYPNAYYQGSIKWIDDFLMKYKSASSTQDSPGAGGAQVFQIADARGDLDKVIGALNTILMLVEDRTGTLTNWDQGSPGSAAARINSYVGVDVDSSTLVKGKNINEGMA